MSISKVKYLKYVAGLANMPKVESVIFHLHEKYFYHMLWLGKIKSENLDKLPKLSCCKSKLIKSINSKGKCRANSSMHLMRRFDFLKMRRGKRGTGGSQLEQPRNIRGSINEMLRAGHRKSVKIACVVDNGSV